MLSLGVRSQPCVLVTRFRHLKPRLERIGAVTLGAKTASLGSADESVPQHEARDCTDCVRGAQNGAIV